MQSNQEVGKVVHCGELQSVLVPGSSGSYNVKLYIPIEINVKVGAPVTLPDAAPALQRTGDVFETALQKTIEQFGSRPDVLKIRSGYRFKNGWITDERVIAIEVREKVDFGDLQPSGKMSG